MSLGAAIDTAIGLMLVFLLVSLIVSTIQETIAALFAWRGKGLRQGIATMLAAQGTTADFKSPLFQAVYNHPLIQNLATAKYPSYIPARNFALALIAGLRGGSQSPIFTQIETTVAAMPDSPVRKALTSLVVQAGGDLDAFTGSVQTWFDDAMDRVSGTYKRYVQYCTFLIGLLLAVILNVDTLLIAQRLWVDPIARANAVAAAQGVVTKQQAAQQAAGNTGGGDTTSGTTDQARVEALQKQLAAAQAELASLPVPLGWSKACVARMTAFLPQVTGVPAPDAAEKSGATALQLCLTEGGLAPALLGWLVTAFAVSFGAPFWFDTLQSFLNIRAAGPPPDKAPPQT